MDPRWPEWIVFESWFGESGERNIIFLNGFLQVSELPATHVIIPTISLP